MIILGTNAITVLNSFGMDRLKIFETTIADFDNVQRISTLQRPEQSIVTMQV
jgi:hypothetical protein